MEIKDIFIPVTKNPVPPDEVDLMRIVLLESIFKSDENGKMKQYQKVYYETLFQGKKVSEGNNYVPSELVPYIFDAKNNAKIIDYAMQSFGFSIIHEVLEKNPDVFKNPYIIQIQNELNNPENARTIENPTTIAPEPIESNQTAEPAESSSVATATITPAN